MKNIKEKSTFSDYNAKLLANNAMDNIRLIGGIPIFINEEDDIDEQEPTGIGRQPSYRK